MPQLKELPYALMIAGGVLLGLYLSNYFYDNNIPQYVTRKLPHIAACIGFLIAPFVFSSFWWPLILTAGFSLLLVYARLFDPRKFRGVGGSGRLQAIAEIHVPVAGVILFAVCWGWLDRPWLAVTPLLFVGGGDAITGIVRSAVYKKEVKGSWGSLAMLVTCLLLAYFMKPYWIGAVGAVVATMVEKYTRSSQFIDDNITIPLVSALVMTLLYIFV